MDLFFAGIVGALIGWLIMLLISKKRKKRAESTAGDTQSSHPNAQLISDPLTEREREERRRKDERFKELAQEYGDAEGIEEHRRVLRRVESSKHQLLENDYVRLVGYLNTEISNLEERAAAEALLAPKLAAFQQLKNRQDGAELFEALHRIHFKEDGILTLDELEEHAEGSDKQWFYEKYEALLVEHLRGLLLAARVGTAADYERVTQLWDDLEDFETTTGMWRDELIEKYLRDEWNQVVVRFIREPDSDEDLFGLDELGEDDYRALIEKIRESDDPLSMKVALILLDESSFDETVVEVFRETIETRIEQFHESIGFKPDEAVRST